MSRCSSHLHCHTLAQACLFSWSEVVHTPAIKIISYLILRNIPWKCNLLLIRTSFLGNIRRKCNLYLIRNSSAANIDWKFHVLLYFRKILVSIKFVSAILGPEMAAPILWTPGKMRSFCRKTHVHRIPRFGGGGSADFIFMGARIFLIIVLQSFGSAHVSHKDPCLSTMQVSKARGCAG